MKFIHLGDLHLGKSLGEFDLISDQEYLLDQVFKTAEEQQIKYIILAGDIYDRAIPSEAAVRLFDSFIRKIRMQGMEAFIITGNHDSDERLNFGSSLFEDSGIHIAAKFEGTLQHYALEDEYGAVNVYLLPFVKASLVRHYYPEETIETYEDAVRVIFEKTQIDPKERNIIVSHQFVAGKAADPAFAGSEGMAVQSVGLVEKIGYDIFDDFDYAALGHIHKPQQIGREEVRYSGSLMKYSLREANDNKSYPVVTIEEKGNTKIELIPLEPKRNLRHIKGPMKQLLAPENVTDPQDFIYATLTDEDMITDVMGIFQQTYPNTVKIEYENSHTREVMETDITQVTENKTFPELAAEFYQQMYGCEITEEEMKYLETAAKEAGIR